MIGAIAGTVLLAFSAAVNTAAVFASRSPDLVLMIWPGDARATIRKAATYLKGEVPTPRAVALAKDAIRRDPTRPLPFVLIALDPRASNTAQQRALAYSRKLSRRDTGTTFLLLQNAIKSGDIEAFFANFDTAVRTSAQAAEQFTPIIVKAMADDRIVDGLAKLLAEDPPWGREFILAAINGAPTASQALRLVTAVRRSGVGVDSDYQGVLINRLLADGKFADAWSLYRATFPDRAKDNLRPVERALKTATGFDWLLANDPDLWAQVEGSGNNRALRYFANAGAGGVVANQYIVLSPGRYTLSYKASTEAGSAFQSRWVAACRGSQIIAEADARRGGRLTFSVPAGCPAIELRLTANADLNVSENGGLIEDLRLVAGGA